MNAVRLFGQIKHACLSLKQAPGFTSTILLTLSLTLGCFFVVMSLFSSYFVKPLPVDNESRLVVVEQDNVFSDKSSAGYQSFGSIVHWYKTHKNFERVAAVNTGQDVIMNLPDQPKLDMTYASDDYYDLVNMPLALGRYLTKQTHLAEKSTEVLISYRLWQKYYDGKDDVLGQTLSDVNASYTIVGVVAKEFVNPFMFNQGKGDLWYHFSSDLRHFGERPSAWWNLFFNLRLIGELKNGETPESTKQFLHARLQDIKSEWKTEFDEVDDLVPIVTPYRAKELGGNDNLALFMLAGVSSLVLIALLNVSNLFISRAVVKHKQLALQAVLGAKRRTIFSAILVESSVLMIGSVLVALFIAAWGIKLFKFLSVGHLPLVETIALDTTVIISAIVSCALLAWLFAFITSRMINFNQLRQQIQSSGKGAVSQIRTSTVKCMIAIQLFLATVLVTGSSLVLNKTLQTLNRPLGSEVDNLYSILIFIRAPELALPERVDFIELLRNNINTLPHVVQVGHGDSPVDQSVRSTTLKDLSGKETIFMPRAEVGRDYFDITQLKILEGRPFSEAAIRGEANELMVTKAVNDLLKPGGSLVGEKFFSFDPVNPFEIVGVTENFNHPKFYETHQGRRIWFPAMAYAFPFIVKMAPGQALDREQLLQSVSSVDSRFGLWKFDKLDVEYGKMVYMERITLGLCVTLALFTLVLAGIGIYGVLSYNLGLRRYEFGIRMALGAKQKRLYQLLLNDTLLPLLLAFGLAIVLTLMVYAAFKASLAAWLILDTSWLLVVSAGILSFALFASVYPMTKLLSAKPMAALKQN